MRITTITDLSTQLLCPCSYFTIRSSERNTEGTHQQCVGTTCHFLSTFRVDEVDIQWALFYLYYKATAEVDKFCKPDKILRDMFRLGGILFHKSRIADGRRYMMSAGMKNVESVAAQNINLFTLVVDRWSPLAYSLADWIHTDVDLCVLY